MKNRNFCIFAAAVQSFYKKRSPETIDFRAPFPQSVLPYQELLGNYNEFPHTCRLALVLPYQELLGNYNRSRRNRSRHTVLPYQELLGNYNTALLQSAHLVVLPYQELLGNYNLNPTWVEWLMGFTIPRTARELQPSRPYMPTGRLFYHTKNC